MLHFCPGAVCLVDALELDAACSVVGRDFVEPLNGFAGIGVDALSAILQAMELGESLLSC